GGENARLGAVAADEVDEAATLEEDDGEQTFELSSSGLFLVDDGQEIPNADKLEHIWSSISQEVDQGESSEARRGGQMDMMGQAGSEPYIHVIRGSDFA